MPYADPEVRRAYHKAYYEEHKILTGPHEKTEEHKRKLQQGASQWVREHLAKQRADGAYKSPPYTKHEGRIRRVSRVVWEAANGRRLRTDEIVHHIDRNHFNNDPTNLQAMTQADHIRLHLHGSQGQSRMEESTR